jgi:hypothetical protein
MNNGLSPQARLEAWQGEQLARWRGEPPAPAATGRVTALAYWFWEDDRQDRLFPSLECAFRATWYHCGHLPSRIVVHRPTPAVQAFCEAEAVTLAVEPALTGGLPGMSRECISRLHTRFETDFVLIVQNDGFPLRPGLEPFVGPYDYVAAPWGRPTWYTGLLFPHPAYSVGNGGFSLRSRRLCELAAWYRRRYFRLIPNSWFDTEDIFYARVLRRFAAGYRRRMAFAPPEVAARFAVEGDWELCRQVGGRPFGFHGVRTFAYLLENGAV